MVTLEISLQKTYWGHFSYTFFLQHSHFLLRIHFHLNKELPKLSGETKLNGIENFLGVLKYSTKRGHF